MNQFDFLAGETLLVDKPYGWTSFDVVNKIRWNLKQVLKIKNIKVGHAGTLDPLATGLLIVGTGKHTKRIDQLMPGEKTYTGTFLLGKTTPSFDLETECNAEFEIDHITKEMIEEVRLSFMGETEQMPPVFSAKQIDGKRAYDLARSGKTVELKMNKIHITHFVTKCERFPEIDFELSCTKGTYIRSIAHDFGKKLQSGATLIALRRTRSGNFSIENSRSVDTWIDIIRNHSLISS
jgi:tRNA pseudouridine55 synthase